MKTTSAVPARHVVATTAIVVAAALCALSLDASAQTLTAPAQRITDQAIHADYQGYAAQQAAIKTLNDSGQHRVASYSLAKAQCWLDVSFHEYTRNDRSAFPEQALQESAKITRYLAGGGAVDGIENPALLTPLVNDAARLREDLWRTAATVRESAGRACAAQRAACGEVELVHAGNEYKQQGWRHAKPYIQIAEDQLGDAQAAAERCLPPPAPIVTAVAAPPAVVPAPVVPAPPAPVAPVEMEASANVLFNFDRFDIGNVRPLTRAKLDELIARINAGELGRIRAITITGHADRSNRTGQRDYNDRLSLKRAATVKAYLSEHGVDVRQAKLRAMSDSVEVAACREFRLKGDHKAFEECLLPNRRVEVKVEALRAPR